MAEQQFDIEELMRQKGITDPFAAQDGGMAANPAAVSATQPAGAPVPMDALMPTPDLSGGLSPDVMPKPAGNGRDQRDSLRWGSVGTMNGFQVGSDYGGDLKARNSVKNTFGRLASNYASTPEGLKQLVNSAEFKQYFPNAKMLDGGAGDKIDFGGVLSDFESGSPVGVVDVGQAFDPTANSGAGFAWMPDEGGGPGGGGGGMGAGGLDLASILAGTGDPLNDIIKRVQDLQNGQTPDAENQALIDMLTRVGV